MNSDAVLRDVEVMRTGGMMLTTPNEARLRADSLLLIGAGLVEAWPELPERLFVRPPMAQADAKPPRRILWLCPGGDPTKLAGRAKVQVVGRNRQDLPVLLAALRARIAGRPVGKTALSAKALDALAADLRAARFGVAVWSAAELDTLTDRDAVWPGRGPECDAPASAVSRWRPRDNALGVLQACGWMTGFPMRTSFGRGFPEHDTWRFDAARLVESGEADCARLDFRLPRGGARVDSAQVPMIALTGRTRDFGSSRAFTSMLAGPAPITTRSSTTRQPERSCRWWRRTQARPFRSPLCSRRSPRRCRPLERGRADPDQGWPRHRSCQRPGRRRRHLDPRWPDHRGARRQLAPMRPMTPPARSSWRAPSTSIPTSPAAT